MSFHNPFLNKTKCNNIIVGNRGEIPGCFSFALKQGGEVLQEEANEKTVGLAVQTTKLTGRSFAKVASLYLQHRKEQKRANPKDITQQAKKVKVKDLVKEGSGVSSIAIQDEEIRRFERIARKNGVRYAIKKDKATNPPTYYIFFKAKDVDVIDATLREFTKKQLNKNKQPVIKQKLQKFKAVIQQLGAKKTKTRNKQQTR